MRNASIFSQHAIHFKTRIFCRKNMESIFQSNHETNPRWSALLFNTIQFVAFHFEVEALDMYELCDYITAKRQNIWFEIGPTPSFYSFFRRKFVENIPRVWLDFSGKSDGNIGAEFEDVLYGDWGLIDECIRWLALPLPSARIQKSEGIRTVQNTEKPANENDWNPPALVSCERILHVGNERGKLNMAHIIDFVQTLLKVSNS